ncbi:rod shape-determining protein MreD [Apilactobacillus xinyiensis]|uniref:rod shape-determining protein MreD n=1 Tax=Apilactobacillus xinyiensis TaxID=2841032 RepID=UPI001C7DF43B|nr:rod shape-determining protein MreD [Apilactobacillus xinyiensis]
MNNLLRNTAFKYVFPIGMLISIFLDGSIFSIFGASLSFHAVPNLSFLWIFLTMFFINDDEIHYELWAMLAGIIIDLFYMGFLGVYTFIFPLAIYFSRWIYKHLPLNIISAFLIYFIDITMIYSLSLLANRLESLTNMSWSFYLVYVLGPTLVINLAFLIILYIPIQSLFDKLK